MTIELVGKGGANRPPIELINSGTDATVLGTVITPAKFINSGALTSEVYSDILDITGRGVLNYLSLMMVDATARTLAMRVTIDGVVVYNAQTGSKTVAFTGIFAVGSADSSERISMDQVPFNKTLLVEVKSSLTETDKLRIHTIYRLT